MTSELASRRSGLARLQGALTRAEWSRLASMLAVIVALHLIGWATLAYIVEPARLTVGGKAFGVGVGLTAYTLGLRHAFDADHIAAIDNTTRKLMGDGQRPLGVGFFFSLGHSTVVFVLALLLATGVKAIMGPVENDSSTLHHYTGLIGTSVSGMFLYLIAILNVIVLVGILRVFSRLRRGDYDEAELEQQLENRGLLNRFLGRFTKSITRSWHMYPVGLLFGLGFDTATEIALLVLAGTSAAAGLPWYAILCLPVLFTAGLLRRTRVRRSRAEIAAAGTLIGAEAIQMNSDPAITPTFAAHCRTCEFIRPCLALVEGTDPEPMLVADYRRHPGEDQAKPRLGQATWGFGRGAAPPQW